MSSAIQLRVLFKEEQTRVTQTLELEGIRIDLVTYTNKFDGLWYMDMLDGEGDPIVRGIALVVGLDLMYRYRYKDTVPPGIFMVQDQSGTPFIDPNLESFINDDAMLLYIASDQVFLPPPPAPEVVPVVVPPVP